MASRYTAAYAHPSGPGDGRPTAEQVVRDEGLIGKWADKVILITGCSSGIGVETAKALSKTGAKLYLTARNLQKAKTALGELAESPNIRLLPLDQESLDSVRSCAAEFLAENNKFHLLVTNAGVMMTRKETTKDGFELQFGVNDLSHFLLTNLLMPALLSASTPSFHSPLKSTCIFLHWSQVLCGQFQRHQLRRQVRRHAGVWAEQNGEFVDCKRDRETIWV